MTPLDEERLQELVIAHEAGKDIATRRDILLLALAVQELLGIKQEVAASSELVLGLCDKVRKLGKAPQD